MSVELPFSQMQEAMEDWTLTPCSFLVYFPLCTSLAYVYTAAQRYAAQSLLN